MTNLTEKEQWEDGVYQIEKTDPVVGGPDGLSNRQGQQLANRTKYLKGLVDGLLNGARNAAVAVKLATPRAVKLTGDATATGTFDGSADLSLTVTLADTGVAAGTYGGVTLDKKGRAVAATTYLPIASGGTGNGSGQAVSAAKLATARTINGVPFDGTANIAITDDSKAPLNSPQLTGDPRAPTPAAGDNDTSIATTAFVQAAIAALVNGSPEALNQLNELAAALGNNPNYATDMATALGLKANSESPNLTGTPKAPRPAVGTNTDQIQTAAGVLAQLAAFGLGAKNLTNLTDLDDKTIPPGIYMFGTGTKGTAPDTYGVVLIASQAAGTSNSNWANQLFFGTRGKISFRNSINLADWSTWTTLSMAEALATVATSGKFSDLLPQRDHVLVGATEANGWKLVSLQNQEATGNLSLEIRNSGGFTTMSYQAVNDGKGGWRPKWYFTPSGAANADRRAYFGGVNDSDQLEYVVKTRIRPGSNWIADPSGANLCVQNDASDGTGGISVLSYAPTLAMLDRTANARSARWKTDGNRMYLEWDNADLGASWGASKFAITPEGEVVSSSSNGFRLAYGDYGAFWRNDGAALYLMLTAKGDPWGTWNNLRPFTMNLVTGKIAMSAGLEVLTKARGDSSNDAASTGFVQDATGTRTAEIVFFPSSSAPAGFLKANGAAVSRSTYAALFAVIGTNYGAGDGSSTFNLPDLRGEFLRAWDDGRGVDNGRALNTSQGSQNLLHDHPASTGSAGAHNHTMTWNNDGAQLGNNDNSIFGDENRYGTVTMTTSTAGAHSHSVTIGTSGGNESRPRNVALLACIKY